VPWLGRLFSEMLQSHTMIAKAEAIMWEARRPSASVAMLIDKSSQFWDDWAILRPIALCLAGCTSPGNIDATKSLLKLLFWT